MAQKQPWLPLSSVHQRELLAFGLYRLLEGALLLLLAFGPEWLGVQRRDPGLLQGVAVLYFCAALLLIELGRIAALREAAQASIGLAIDIAAAMVTLAAQQGFDGGVALLLLFNITIACLLLDGRTSAIMAATAIIGVLLEHAVDARGCGCRAVAVPAARNRPQRGAGRPARQRAGAPRRGE
jgi:two-component system, NtrC family, sensor histidine kinase PilS